MPLKKGNTNIGAIYKGTTQIAKVYKGTTLLFENAKWLDYYFNNLYNSLIPTTIDNKTVQDKAKLTKIEGNGVVENQWLSDDYYPNRTINGITISYDKSTHTLTLNGTASTTFNFDLNPSKEIFSGRKYLITAEMAETINSRFALRYASVGPYLGYRSNDIYNDTNSKIGKICALGNGGETNTSTFKINIYSGAVFNSLQVKNIQYIDLTLMFGTGNEPTDINDNRIQALLNRGYIAYNTGSYKNSKVSEIETFDSSNQLLDTITLNGLLELNGALSAHDTFEITNTGYVFTRNIGVVDLGTLSWGYDSYSDDGTVVRVTQRITEMKELADSIGFGKGFTVVNYEVSYNSGANLISTKTYQNIVYTNISQSVLTALGWDGSSTTVGSYAKTYLSGVMLYYELATPQVITIPKKHLGCVDLGKLTYTMTGSGQTAYFRAYIVDSNIPQAKGGSSSVLSNIYCNKYIVAYRNDITYSDSSAPNNLISLEYASAMGTTSVVVYIRDLSYTNANDIKSAMAGIYLFYETNAEVSDFDNVAQINAGGNITSDSEVLPNVSFKIKCK